MVEQIKSKIFEFQCTRGKQNNFTTYMIFCFCKQVRFLHHQAQACASGVAVTGSKYAYNMLKAKHVKFFLLLNNGSSLYINEIYRFS